MARIKEWWNAHLNSRGVHLISASNTYAVRIGSILDRDPARLIYTDLTPDAARSLAADLITFADRADALNGKAFRAARADLFEALDTRRTGINHGVQVSHADAADAFAARIEEFEVKPGDRVNIEAGDHQWSWGIVKLIDQDGLFHVAPCDGPDHRVYQRDEITK
jgi:hypothetical protein